MPHDLVVGKRLPSPYYEFATDRSLAVPIYRKCPECGFAWTNVEIPLWKRWPAAHKANRCPTHTDTVGGITAVWPVRKLEEMYAERPLGYGLEPIMFGAVVRKRKCRMCVNCEHLAPVRKHQESAPCEKCGCTLQATCKNPRTGKPTKWTTIEVTSEGVFAVDVTQCPVCDAFANTTEKAGWARLRWLRAKEKK